MKSRNPSVTRQQILDVAERHFAVYGYAGTSLRGIIKDANVNVASVAYHYGTKEELLDAVVERFAIPVVAAQIEALDRLKDTSDLRAVLEAFYLPPLDLVKGRGEGGATLALFLGRIQTEPEPIFGIVDKHFAECRNRFVAAFGRCLPNASAADLQWHFEFMLSLIVCFLTRQAEIRKRYNAHSEWLPQEAAERMINFCLKGLQ